MIEIQGRYNTAKCYTDHLEEAAARQILSVCDQPAFTGCKLRIMPDVHAGMGCTIGTTMTIRNKIVPGMVVSSYTYCHLLYIIRLFFYCLFPTSFPNQNTNFLRA